MTEKIVSMRDVCFSYEKDKKVLEGINLDIEKGEYVGIVGDNGSAKSTVMKLMLGLLKPDEGDIKLFGKSTASFDEWGRIGYISQQVRNFNPNFPATVEEVVGANLYSQKGFLKFLDKSDRRKIWEVLKIVKMEDYSKKLLGSLSGGQQQKVFIARLLIGTPDVIFMDEPLVGVDYVSQESIYDILDHINAFHGTSIVMVTHDIKEIFNRADKMICLNNKKTNAYIGIKKMEHKDKINIIRENLNVLIE